MAAKKRQSFTAEFKLEVCEFAEQNTNRSVAKHYGIDEKNVRKWRKMKHILQAMAKTKKSLRHKTAKWPELEQDLKQWILDLRSNEAHVTTTGIILQAKLLAQERNINDFSASNGWFKRFMARNGLSVRVRTTLSEESEGKDESEDAYMNEIRIVNINAGDECEDETPSVSAKAPIRIQKRKPNDTKGFRDKLLRHDGQDEFDIFGQHVSHELRKLRGNRYVLAQTKRRIYQALIDADLMSLYPTAPSAKARFNQHDHVNGNDDEEN